MSDDGYTRITLRIPDGLHAKLTGEAARTSKSMNAEIVARLEGSFDTPAHEEGSEVGLLTDAWTSAKEHLQWLEYEVADMEALASSTSDCLTNENKQPPSWTPPAPLPEWTPLSDALAFYRSWRDAAKSDLEVLSQKLFSSMGMIFSEAKPNNSADSRSGKSRKHLPPKPKP